MARLRTRMLGLAFSAAFRILTDSLWPVCPQALYPTTHNSGAASQPVLGAPHGVGSAPEHRRRLRCHSPASFAKATSGLKQG